MPKQIKYSGKTTSKIIQCTSSQQLSALIKKVKKEDAKYFGSYEISCAIKQFAKFKDYRASFILFNDIKNQDPSKLDQSLYSYMIKLCLDQYGHNIDSDSSILQKKRIKALQSSKKLFFEMQHQFNLDPNEYVMTALLSNCSKVISKKSLRMAEHHWKKMMNNEYEQIKVDHVVWNAMISVYLKHFKLNKAMELFDEMTKIINPDQTTYLLMINGFRLNCNELIIPKVDHDAKNSDDYIQRNIEENCISKEKMIKFTVQTFKDSLQKLGSPSIELLGCVIHNFAVIGDVDTCLSLLYFMMNEQDNVNGLCDMELIENLGLNVIEDMNQIVFPNTICFNLCLKAILCHTEILLKDRMSFENVKASKYLEWDFIENSILYHLKNLEISKELFVSYKILIQLCEIKMEYMSLKIKHMVENIKSDEEMQNEYLSKVYEREIMEIFDKLKIFFEEMTNVYKFKPNQKMFDQIYKMGFKFTTLYNEYPALFDDLESDPLKHFNQWLLTQMKQYGLK